MESTGSHQKERAGENRNPLAGQTTRCVIAPRDGLDKASIQNIEDFLKEITQAKEIYSFTDNDGKFRWWIVYVTPEQLNEIKEHKEVVYAGESWKMVEARVARHSFERTKRSLDKDAELGRLPMLEKRDETQVYEAQLNAVKELRQISTPKDVSDLGQ